ncbi:MAG: hypothetical protein GC162_03695 [Planctomycetes bacterium]|nr:hypothetical protein [Planctomycetota bacterium]
MATCLRSTLRRPRRPLRPRRPRSPPHRPPRRRRRTSDRELAIDTHRPLTPMTNRRPLVGGFFEDACPFFAFGPDRLK